MKVSASDVMVFIDPSDYAFYKNEAFNESSPLNRDGQFTPGLFLREKLATRGISLNTADYLLSGQVPGKVNVYISMGIITNYKYLHNRPDVIMQSFYIMEPTIVAPYLYGEIDNLSRNFDIVYVHNTYGVGYERYFRDQPNLRKYYVPQIHSRVIEHLWLNNKDRALLTMINSNRTASRSIQLIPGRNPMSLQIRLNDNSKCSELYSERIRAVVALKHLGDIDLYGPGWDKSFYRMLLAIPRNQTFPYLYWKNRKELWSIYKGPVKSKYETMSKYRFAICFENMIMPGYITEKLFDCFFVGTIPIYLGAPDIEQYVPEDCFIDMRDFNTYEALYEHLSNLCEADIASYREAAREYLSSEQYQPFTKESFANQFEADLKETLTAHDISISV